MAGSSESKITRFGVANLSNSCAITCDPRLESGDFNSQTCSPRIDQRLSKYTAKPQEKSKTLIEEGAYADILLVDGNPLEDISVIGGNAKLFDAPDREAGGIDSIRLIMKDGKVYKNTL